MFVVLLGLLLEGRSIENHIVYKGRDYGFESVFNPITIILNAGYEQVQLEPDTSRNISKFDHTTSFENVTHNFMAPIPPINHLGWWRFTKTELFPLSWSKDRAQWWPNYQLHLLGGGLTSRGLAEWYDAQGVTYPWVAAFLNYEIYQWLNEMVENGKHKGDNTDAIADLWLFNHAGFLLFMNDSVARFFVEKLNFADWSPQPVFMLQDGTIQDNSQRFTMKLFSPWSDHWALFYHFGTTGMAGLTYKLDNGHAFSGAGGFRAQSIEKLDSTKNLRTADLGWTAGIFWDKNNTPMASIVASAFNQDYGSINIYPGIMRIGNFSFGMVGGLKSEGRFYVGMTTVYTPGFGVGNFRE